jgi:hypothetical protein
MPDFDFDAFNHEHSEYNENQPPAESADAEEVEAPAELPKVVTDFSVNTNLGDVDSW